MAMRVLRRRGAAKREGGQAMVEFALIAPLFFLLIFGFVDMARMYQSWVTIQHAAREGARYGVTGRTDCAASTPTRLNCIEYIVREQTDGLANPVGDIDVSVRSWQYPAYADPAVTGNPGDQCDALEVRVDYDFTPATPLIGSIIGDVAMNARERLVNEPFGPCN
jgi:Flp pilus assembly protein TadG